VVLKQVQAALGQVSCTDPTSARLRVDPETTLALARAGGARLAEAAIWLQARACTIAIDLTIGGNDGKLTGDRQVSTRDRERDDPWLRCV